jgi:hypothetical protein
MEGPLALELFLPSQIGKQAQTTYLCASVLPCTCAPLALIGVLLRHSSVPEPCTNLSPMISVPKLKHTDTDNFFLIAGPCAIEGEEIAMEIAERVGEITDKVRDTLHL